MANGKIDKVKLSQMLRSGKSGKDCAKAFGVTEGAISQARKELNIAVVKSVVLESAHQVVDKNLNAVDQLQKINGYANELLDLLMRWEPGRQGGPADTGIASEAGPGTDTEEEVKEYRFKDPRELALKAMAEIRGQLGLQLDIFKALYDLEAVAEFQREVLSTIGEVAPDVRDRIIKKLKESRALRASVSIA